jgi:hydroxypyruvate isomerase
MTTMNRREVLTSAAAALALPQASAAPAGTGRAVVKGRLRQSVCRWCYPKIELTEFFKAVAGMGLTAVDLLSEKEWPIARDHGLICSMGSGPGGSIADGLNVRANHDKILAALTRALPIAASQKVPNLITFFGNRRGMGDPEASANCIEALNKIKGPAEEHGVTICLELLNSKVDHKDYQGDHSAFGVNIVKAVNSPRVKLLYDIYHMQIMEGDVIRTIRENKEWFGHYHTGGVPGRHELDDTQELNWRTIAAAIAETGFQGYFAHEFIPVRDPLTSLRDAVTLCDV